MSSKYSYQPFYNEGYKPHLIRIPFARFAWTTVALTFFALVFCVIWSLAFDFERANVTHCQVYNILPSLSASVGSFSPQKEVWQSAVGLQAIPRFVAILVYRKYHKEVLFPWAYCLSAVACLLNITEVVCLIGLTFWTSTDNYPLHKTCFATFVVSSELYMILTCMLFKRCRRHPPVHAESKSLKIKQRMVIVNISCIFIASYFFMRHNSYCESGVYSLFALSEYIVVLSNMAFHMTAYWDFYDRDLVLKKDCDLDLIYR